MGYPRYYNIRGYSQTLLDLRNITGIAAELLRPVRGGSIELIDISRLGYTAYIASKTNMTTQCFYMVTEVILQILLYGGDIANMADFTGNVYQCIYVDTDGIPWILLH